MARGTDDWMDAMIYVIFGAVAIPIVGEQMLTIEGDTQNYSAAEIALAALVVTFMILGLVYGIYKKLLKSKK